MAVTRFGLQIPNFTFPGVADQDLFARVAEIAVTAEESGFDSLWVMDHFYQIFGRPRTDPMLEAYTLLGALAARTTVSLGTMVTGVTYRNPALLAKKVTTLDVISGGRAVLGIGAAWNDDEHAGYGFGFPPVASAWTVSRRRCRSAGRCSPRAAPSFPGATTGSTRRSTTPAAASRRHPDPRRRQRRARMLRLVARYADACNLFGDLATIRHKLDVLDRHCEAVGRDPARSPRHASAAIVVAETDAEADSEGRATGGARGMDEERYRGYVVAGDPDAVCEQVAPISRPGSTSDLQHVRRPGSRPRGLAGETLARLSS